MDTKICDWCQQPWSRPMGMARAQFAARMYCSRTCYFAAARATNPPKQMLPCRICGKPTRYHGTNKSHLFGMVRCEDPVCIEASRLLKNESIGARATQDYQSQKRKKIRYTWRNVKRISDEETTLSPWFESMGWTPQCRVCTGTVPAMYSLDFGLPMRKLYVEIDGHIHRLRKERDARRDQILRELGWLGVRIPAKDVINDIDTVKYCITLFITTTL